MEFETCNLRPFVSEVVAQASSPEEAASALELFIRQVELYLQQLREAMCNDLQALADLHVGGSP